MQSKISSKWPLFTIAGIAFSLNFLIVIFFLGLPGTGSSSQASQNLVEGKPVESIAFSEQASSGLPMRLKIPLINVDAPVEYVGLASDGAMDVPIGPLNVAWFKLGQRPGDAGSAAIAGHYGLKNGKPSVFDNLHKLRQGDKVYVEDDLGAIITFVVRSSRSYDPKADASGVFGSNDGKSHLNLITCEGIWDEAAKSYPKRLVVFTDQEME